MPAGGPTPSVHEEVEATLAALGYSQSENLPGPPSREPSDPPAKVCRCRKLDARSHCLAESVGGYCVIVIDLT